MKCPKCNHIFRPKKKEIKCKVCKRATDYLKKEYHVGFCVINGKKYKNLNDEDIKPGMILMDGWGQKVTIHRIGLGVYKNGIDVRRICCGRKNWTTSGCLTEINPMKEEINNSSFFNLRLGK